MSRDLIVPRQLFGRHAVPRERSRGAGVVIAWRETPQWKAYYMLIILYYYSMSTILYYYSMITILYYYSMILLL